MEQITYKICTWCDKEFKGLETDIYVSGTEVRSDQVCRACGEEAREFVDGKRYKKTI